MTNLKRFTKDQLIERLKRQEIVSNKNIKTTGVQFFQGVHQILTFLKGLFLKLTFLALFIRIFKRFSILRRIWIIVNTIVMSIFGISMLDIYGLSIISAFFSEINFIFANIITYLTNTKFYATLIGLFGYKIDSTTKMGSMRPVNPSSTELSSKVKESSKISEWFNQEEIVEDKPFYKNKYFIMGTFLLISGVTYYYFGDEIKLNSISLWNWFRGRTPDADPGNNANNLENRYNSWVNLIGINRNNKNININNVEITDILEDAVGLVDTTKPIPSSSAEPMDKYFTTDRPITKGKEIVKSPVLTSPSLDNLNSTVEQSWSNSRPTSPESVSSAATIKPNKLASTSISSSPDDFKHSEIPKLINDTMSINLDEAYYPDNSVKPFIAKFNAKTKISQDNWKLYVNKGILDRMDFIENSFTSDKPLDIETANILVDKISVITKSYDNLTEAYGLMGDNINISIGYNNESPKIISKDIFDD